MGFGFLGGRPTVIPATGAPSAPQALTLTNQTGPSFTSTGTQQLKWGAATAGAFAISYYRVYRNGSQINSNGATTGLTYNDTAATNSNHLTYNGAGTPYYYQVSAVDTNGTEGPLTTDFVVWMYQGANGGSTCNNADFSFGLTSEVYNDTTGSPVGGGTDVQIVWGTVPSGWQPVSDNNLVATWDLELGGFISGGTPAGTSGYGHFDIKPMTSGMTFGYGLISRAEGFGDIFNYIGPNDIAPYVTAPTPGVMTTAVWNSVAVPLNVNSIGTTTFTASVGSPYGSDANGPWATMTITAVAGGVGVDYGGFITSPASIANARVGLQSEGGNPGGIWHLQGSGIITGSTVVSSQTFTSQRTNMYKLALVQRSGANGQTTYFNNVRFTRYGTL